MLDYRLIIVSVVDIRDFQKAFKLGDLQTSIRYVLRTGRREKSTQKEKS